MPNYRRAYVPGGTYFVTVVTHQRRHLFDRKVNRTLLGNVIRQCKKNWSFEINAIVLLPEHLHAIWTLPRGDDNYSGRWSMIKKSFTQSFLNSNGQDWNVSEGKRRENRRGIWQKRFWEHVIEDEEDFETHFDDIHYNPVRHELVSCPRDWEASSFHCWVEKGVYPANRACGSNRRPTFAKHTDEFWKPA